MQPDHRRKIRTAAILITASLVLLALSGLILVNTVVLPRAVDRITARVEAACGCRVSVARAGYLPFRGVRLSNIRVTDAPRNLRLSIASLDTPADLRLISRLRRSRLPDSLQQIDSIADLSTAATEVVGAGLLPRRIVIRGAAVTDPSSGIDLELNRAEYSLTTEEPTIVIETTGVVASAPFTLNGRLDVVAWEGELSVEAHGAALSPFFGPISDGVAGLSVTVRSNGPYRYAFEGRAGVNELSLDMPVLAAEPLSGIDLQYEFAGSLDLRKPIPLERRRPLVVLEGEYGRGVLSVSQGDLTVNGVCARLTGALYGLSRAIAPLPATQQPFLAEFMPPRRSDEEPSALGSWLGQFPRVLHIKVSVADALLSAVQRAVPAGLLGPLQQADVGGQLSWDLDVHVPLDRIADLQWTADTRLADFSITSIPAEIDVFKVNGPFAYTVYDPLLEAPRRVDVPAPAEPDLQLLADLSERNEEQLVWMINRRAEERLPRPAVTGAADRTGTLASAVENPGRVEPVSLGEQEPSIYGLIEEGRTGNGSRYLRLAEMSEWVPKAVLTGEDGDFFFHGGVNFRTLPRAIERNLFAGRVQYGASTISMQLVKLLFLDHSRVFARKLQEVALVYLLEHAAAVQKARILEIYLNIAEFGPGVFGVYDASRYYFAKHPRALDAAEATWLASVLPSPRRYHYYFEQGEISPGWFTRMKGFYSVMLERERITPEQYEKLLEGPPDFPAIALIRAGFPPTAPDESQPDDEPDALEQEQPDAESE